MTKYLALLRGINVGGKHKVEMKKLRQLCEGLGFESVQTYINSGNLIFETDQKSALALASLEAALAKTFKFNIPTVLRECKALKKVVAKIPESWANDAEQRTEVLFIWKEFDSRESLKLLAPVAGVDELVYVPGAIVWHFDRKNYGRTAMRKFIGTPLYKKMTARNVNTVRKLVEMMGE